MGGQFHKEAETRTPCSDTAWETTEEPLQAAASLPYEEVITPTMPTNDRMEGLRKSIVELMEVMDGKNYLFHKRGHWSAVYRVLVDAHFVNDSYKDFANFISCMQLPELRVPFKYDSLKKTVIDSGLYYRPLDEWEERYDGETIKYKNFSAMLKNAHTFREILRRREVV